ncbi:AlpA family phage regulatory protein [Sinorhizobium meliloti]|uniref:helix-turn-helix transcriptional regulator n=1 Tax=Rhizobium meliloti TaxID=382 RepID=UPI000FD3D208|nr:AlpA family phage regulatory protein [Sinorhizobium meliloti]MDW9582498.1 AlpA family phage regulatory protein [Sinorhizobium meliloti]RVG92094.1 AlpA family phage regulatory protein [Sinorhizobium meliloti]RVL63345.1 AlpA family phage regulatory protein [Sinorhizobium meliloti]RVP82060.1 AlpA family phage regulatory protein [Sinorhizobium meliloti]
MVTLLSSEDLKAKGISLSKSQRNVLIQRGLFPKPIKIGLRAIAWPEPEIDAWIQERMKERAGGNA